MENHYSHQLDRGSKVVVSAQSGWSANGERIPSIDSIGVVRDWSEPLSVMTGSRNVHIEVPMYSVWFAYDNEEMELPEDCLIRIQ